MPDTPVLSAEILSEWAQRWRYPTLLEVLEPGGEIGTERAIDAVLAGLAAPSSSPANTVRQLVERGEFAVAKELLADSRVFGDTLSGEEYDEWHRIVDAARRKAAIDLEREIRELTERARRCGAGQPQPAGIAEMLQRSRPAADAALSDFRRDIKNAERELTENLDAELGRRWPDAPESWRASVRASLDAREFGVVRRQLDDGPESDEFAGPAGVPPPRPDDWPWSDRPLAEVRGWYEEGSSPPLGFAQWRPSPDDADARRLVAAMSRVDAELSAETVHDFAAALDGLFGVEEVAHSVAAIGGGYRTVLSGLVDPRLPHLRLPGRMRLWVAPPGCRPPDDDSTVGLWFLPDGYWLDCAVARTAVIDPATLLKLIAPDRNGMPTDRTVRRINLLRAICRQLEPNDVLPAGEFGEGVDDSGLRDDLGWAFDLFGVAIDAVVLDALRYDTGDHPAALWTAVRTIIERRDREPRFTHGELAAWRQDADVRRRVRDAVLAPVRDDLAPLFTTHVALLMYGSDDGAATFTGEELLEWIRALTEQEGLGAELDNLFDMPSVLSRAEATGLYERLPESRYRLTPPGLIALLSGDGLDPLIASTLEELRREGGLLVSKATVNVLLAHQRASSHQIGNRLYDTRAILSSLCTHSDERVRASAEQALKHLKPFDEVRDELSRPDLRRLLRPESVDVVELIDELRRQLETETPGEITVEMLRLPDPAPRPTVRVRRALLRLAVENVLTNSVRSIVDATEEGAVPSGTVLVRVTVLRSDGGHLVHIDVEDSGPGFTEESQRRVSDGVPFTTREGGQGMGLVHTRESLEIDQGRLRFPGQSEHLRGAHVQIVMPYSSPE